MFASLSSMVEVIGWASIRPRVFTRGGSLIQTLYLKGGGGGYYSRYEAFM